MECPIIWPAGCSCGTRVVDSVGMYAGATTYLWVRTTHPPVDTPVHTHTLQLDNKKKIQTLPTPTMTVPAALARFVGASMGAAALYLVLLCSGVQGQTIANFCEGELGEANWACGDVAPVPAQVCRYPTPSPSRVSSLIAVYSIEGCGGRGITHSLTARVCVRPHHLCVFSSYLLWQQQQPPSHFYGATAIYYTVYVS